MTRAYEEVIDFIAGRDPKGVAEFQPSKEALQRFRDLVERQKDETLTPEESAELDTCLDLEHIMRLAKARACQRLGDE